MGLYSGGSKSKKVYKPTPLGGGGGLSLDTPASGGGLEAGKGSIDLTDAAGSIGSTIGSFAEFGSNVVGGIAGAIGSLGPDGETASIGQAVEDIGRIPGGIGDIKLPYAGNDPTRQAATLSQVPGIIGDAISAPGRAVERGVAEGRAGGGLAGDILGGLPGVIPGVSNVQNLTELATGADARALPPDLQARLDEGESVDVIADELLERGQGFSSDAATNLAAEIVFDPLNLIAPGVGKAAQSVKNAGVAVRSADDLAQLGMSQRTVGTIYNMSTNGLSQAGAAIMDRTIGPVTSGVFHALGTKPYQALVRGASQLDRSYGVAFERAFALGAGQLPRAVMAREVMQDVASKLSRKVDDVGAVIEKRMFAKQTTHRDELERRTEELLGRTTPAYPVIDDAVIDATTRKYAAITGMSVEDAARVLGKVDRGTARTVHLAFYGHAGGELADIKKVLPSTKSLDVERLTVIAPDTLTDELADAILAGDISAVDAVENFSVLSNHFGGKVVADSAVLDFITKIKSSLPQAVRLPKSGKNPLPSALSDWRARNSEFGYELGFAPKDGWKSIVDADGEVIMSDPFVHFVSDVDPVTMRNPLGRFMDSLTRGTTQTVIVQESRERMVDFIVRNGVPVSPNEIRAVHKQILEEAADRGLTPRALAGEKSRGGPLYDDIFRRTLPPDAYEALRQKYDPTYVVMQAFKGNWQTVGLTQKLTGAAKALPQGGGMIAKLTEALYPKARFTYRPTFQMQEVIESPVFNALRGVTDREVADDLVDAYRALSEQPEFRYLTEANFLNIAGLRRTEEFMGANTAVGRATARFSNIAARKETARIRQTMYEHGEDFQEAVQKINPRYWKAMEEAYGTTDARIIADRFLAERMALAGDPKAAMDLIDEATASLKSTLDDAVIRPGEEAASQAANVKVGVLNGGSAASGGAMKVEGALPSSASDIVLQAFKDSFREASNRAFQTHFFNPQRGWLERTLNHPYLGLYPLSYMWGKVLVEFSRFLIKRPFGMNAPGLGLANLERVQQAYLGALADDPEFASYIEENEDAIYFANLLFPGNPVNMTVNAPAWARHVTEDAAAGKLKDPGKTITREVVDSGSYAFGPIHDATSIQKTASDLVDIGSDIFAQLTKAAQQYDGQFPSGAPKPLTGTPLTP